MKPKNTLFAATSFLTVFGLAATADAAAVPVLGDVNADCVVSVDDQLELLGHVGTNWYPGDFNGDGTVTSADVDMLIANFGATCGQRLLGDVDGNGLVNVNDYLLMLSHNGSTHPQTDLNGDGVTNQVDVDLLTSNFGGTCARADLGDVDCSTVVDVNDALVVIGLQGTTDSAGDLDGDGQVDSRDIDLLAANWGHRASADLPGDVDGDWVVDQVDHDLLAAAFGSNWAPADIDASGLVNINDFLALSARFGDAAGRKLVGDINGDWIVDDVDIDLVEVTLGTSWAAADVDDNGTVDISDFLATLGNYGASYGTTLAGDINGDCEVDQTDADLLEAALGSAWLQADLTGDEIIDVQDHLLLVGNFGATC